jgi:hypothetical protein
MTVRRPRVVARPILRLIMDRRVFSPLLPAVLVSALSVSPSPALAADTPPSASDPAPRAPLTAVPTSLCGGPTARCEPPTIEAWPEGASAPPGYHWGSRSRYGAIGLGSGLFGVPWLLGGAVWALEQTSAIPDAHVDWLLVPVAGPFIELAVASSPPTAVTVALVTDAVLQAVGMGLIVYGSAWPVPVLVRDDMGAVGVVPVPILGSDRVGLGLAGVF